MAHERARQLEAGHGLAHLPLMDTADASGRRRKGKSAATRKVAALVSGSSGDIDGDAVDVEAEENVEDEEDEEIVFGFVDSLSHDGERDPSATMGGPGPLHAAGIVSSSSHALRPVSAQDFKEAIKKLKASVDEGGRELQKVCIMQHHTQLRPLTFLRSIIGYIPHIRCRTGTTSTAR